MTRDYREKINICSEFGIKRLPPQLSKNGYDYTLVKRDDYRAIYKQHVGDCDRFEIFKTRLSNRHKFLVRIGKEPEGEIYMETFPGDEEFGVRAWTYHSLEDAEARYNSI